MVYRRRRATSLARERAIEVDMYSVGETLWESKWVLVMVGILFVWSGIERMGSKFGQFHLHPSFPA